MATEYARSLLRVAVAQISQSLGWNAVQSTPIELLTDVMERHILEVGHYTQRYAEQFGRTDPNLDDLGLAFQDLGIKLSELDDYVQHVDAVPFAVDVPKFPVPKESLLHFPKPNSRELLNREEHVHEHLPPMHTDWDEEIVEAEASPAHNHVAEENTLTSPQAPAIGPDKRPAPPPADVVPSKRAKNLPEEAGHSQYMMKRVWISSSGLPTGTQGILPDARTPPPPTPTPHPQKTVMIPFSNVESESAKSETPVPLKPSVISETVEIRSSGGMENNSAFRVENIDKMPQPKSPKYSKAPPKSPKGKSPKAGVKSPKASPKSLKGRPQKVIGTPLKTENTPPKSSNLKTVKVVKSPKVKKVKPPKVLKSPKVPGIPSPKTTKSPRKGKEKDASGKVIKVAKVLQSPHVPPVQGDIDLGAKSGSSGVRPDSMEPALPILLRSPSPQGRVLDLSIPKLSVPTKAARKEMHPSLSMMKQEFPAGPDDNLIEEPVEAKESRLASYDDVIDSVAMDIKKEDSLVPEYIQTPAQPVVYSEEIRHSPGPTVKQEKGIKVIKSEKKQKKPKRDTASNDTIDDVAVSVEPPTIVVPIKSEDTPPQLPNVTSYDHVDTVLPTSAAPVEFPSPASTSKPKKDRPSKKDKKPKKLTIKIPESAPTVLSGEDSDASRASRPHPRERSFSPPSPKVLLEQLTPDDIKRFSYSPEKKLVQSPSLEPVAEEKPEAAPVHTPIQPIKLDISQPKISIKIPKDGDSKSERDSKKEKKKKKNKDKDREKSKEKKDKSRDKEKKKDRKDKEKRKHKEESTTVGGPGFKLTLKFGGLKTATPTMSVTEQEQSPKQESLKMVIKHKSSSKHKPKSTPTIPKPATPPPPSPPPSPVHISSPSPSPQHHSPSPYQSPLPSPLPSPVHQRSPSVSSRDRSASPGPPSSVHHSPSRSPSPSPMPVLQHQSALSAFEPFITFSPLPSPAPHIELPPSRTPSPCPRRSPSPDIVKAATDESEDEDESEADMSTARGITSETVGMIKDEDGETIWICPACKMQDDGSPMIGCDKCDDWYHWPCVGIKRAPPEKQQWFCPKCRVLHDKMEKKRKPVKAKPGRKKMKKQ